LAEELTRQNHPVTNRTVATLPKRTGHSLQANRKTREGSSHPDRNAQFEQINKQVLAFQKQNQPLISLETKKKKLVGEFKNPGQEWRPKGEPEKVNVHDFPDKRLGKVIPYAVDDLASNEGWGSVGIDHDTAQFAVASIRRWWTEMGSGRFRRGNKLLITADGGGSKSDMGGDCPACRSGHTIRFHPTRISKVPHPWQRRWIQTRSEPCPERPDHRNDADCGPLALARGRACGQHRAEPGCLSGSRRRG